MRAPSTPPKPWPPAAAADGHVDVAESDLAFDLAVPTAMGGTSAGANPSSSSPPGTPPASTPPCRPSPGSRRSRSTARASAPASPSAPRSPAASRRRRARVVIRTDHDAAQALADAAHQVCPYSNATGATSRWSSPSPTTDRSASCDLPEGIGQVRGNTSGIAPAGAPRPAARCLRAQQHLALSASVSVERRDRDLVQREGGRDQQRDLAGEQLEKVSPMSRRRTSGAI